MASNDGGGDSPSLPRGLLGRNRGKSPRLPSIRAPRDLTLGGSTKKTFVPNIPARPRDKSKEDSRRNVNRDSSSGRNHEKSGGRGRGDRGRGRGRGRGDFIQTQSIFEQGAADRMRPRNHEPIERVVIGSGPARPAIKKEKKDDKETKRILDDLLRDDFVDGPICSDPMMNPITLPLFMDDSNSLDIKSKSKVNISIKEEKHDDDEKPEDSCEVTDVNEAQEKLAAKDKRTYAKHISELFSGADASEFGDLVLIQFPDTLPGEPPESDDHQSRRNTSGKQQQSASTSQSAHETTQETPEDLSVKFGSCKLKDFSEGYIGKLRVHKSGRTTLVLGNVALDVNMGTPTGFLQEVVSCRISHGEKTGDISVLGHVNNKLVCIPDFDSMLEES